MKVINLSIPEETWRLARIEAAKRSTSLSALVRGYLEAMVRGQAPVILDRGSADHDREQRAALVAELQSSEMILGFTPSRSQTYDR
jgi:hypothetical protein